MPDHHHRRFDIWRRRTHGAFNCRDSIGGRLAHISQSIFETGENLRTDVTSHNQLAADVVISLNLKFSKIETVGMSAVRAEGIERGSTRSRHRCVDRSIRAVPRSAAYNYRSARNAPAEKV